MLNWQNATINTAGAYVCLGDLFLFTVGIWPHNGQIPIVRLGGHREAQETGWQCAVREVQEEANLNIQPLSPHITYLCDWDHLEGALHEIQWQPEIEQEPSPLLVITHRHEEKTSLSLMYLAYANGIPRPSSEVKGLLLLQKEEIHRLCQEPLTLEQYLNRGGKAILKDGFDTGLVLTPFAQLRLLSRMLSLPSKGKAAHPITAALGTLAP